MSIEAGTLIGRYEIQSLLGAGGMGEVYRALDTELHRSVALKFLRPEVASDEKRMQRFIQEARSASALNHPNILTVYEIGQSDGVRFFATEFVDGVTLRQALATRKMKLIEVLDVAIQVASALAAAHAAGIVHRDIKPENIMVRKDGYVKVLDFGLAKFTDPAYSSVDTEAATRALINTDPGAVMGTASYMSPEQAGAKAVDGRTDIWSLGVVLYEMVTGHAPFEGATTSHVIVGILEKEPLPLAAYIEDVPEALEWIVTEALTKDREERTQTARELLKKLQRLKQRVDANAEIERSVAPDRLSSSGSGVGIVGSKASGINQSVQRTMTATERAAARTGEVAAATAPHRSSAEYVISRIKEHKLGVMLALAAFVVLLGGLGFGLYKLLWSGKSESQAQKEAPAFQSMKITRLTTSGKTGSASISPDGKHVVHKESERGGQASLWIRQVFSNNAVQIVAPAEGDFVGSTFSPDSNLVYYVWFDKTDNPLGALYQVSALGGTPRKLLSHVSGPVTFSPDGKQIAFVRYHENDGTSSLVIASAEGTGERTILKVDGTTRWLSGEGPAWSPDGRVIACGAGNTAGGTYMTVIEVPVEGGSERPLTSQKWSGQVSRVIWMPDGSGMIVAAAADEASGTNLVSQLSGRRGSQNYERPELLRHIQSRCIGGWAHARDRAGRLSRSGLADLRE